MAEVLEQNRDREKFLQKDNQGQTLEDKVAMGALESALAAAEEDLDVQAAKTAMIVIGILRWMPKHKTGVIE